MSKNKIILVNENYLKDKVYTIRGVPVMLDYDLAYIYGYTTKRLNEQVQRNIDKFDEDFWFQLTEEELKEILSRSQDITSHNDSSRSQFVTLNDDSIIQRDTSHNDPLRSKNLTLNNDDSRLEKTTLKITENPLNRGDLTRNDLDSNLNIKNEISHNDSSRSIFSTLKNDSLLEDETSHNDPLRSQIATLKDQHSSSSNSKTSHNNRLRSKNSTSISDDSMSQKKILDISKKPLNRPYLTINDLEDNSIIQNETSHNTVSWSQFATSIQTKGIKGGRTSLPYAFTEQGLYMLMTVLKGELAIKQSKALIRLFKKMKDYIINNNYYITNKLLKHDMDISYLKDNMITRNDLPLMIDLFESNISSEEILLLNNQPFKADIAYYNIFNKARNNIIIIDDYISIKTLEYLIDCNENISLTIISDNKNNQLTLNIYNDFIKQYPRKNISFIKSHNKIHDRFIIIDYKTNNMKIYLSGNSLKDSGNRITTITEINNINIYNDFIENALKGNELILK